MSFTPFMPDDAEVFLQHDGRFDGISGPIAEAFVRSGGFMQNLLVDVSGIRHQQLPVYVCCFVMEF